MVYCYALCAVFLRSCVTMPRLRAHHSWLCVGSENLSVSVATAVGVGSKFLKFLLHTLCTPTCIAFTSRQLSLLLSLVIERSSPTHFLVVPFVVIVMSDSASITEDDEFVDQIAEAASSLNPAIFKQEMRKWFLDENRDAAASACSLQGTNNKKKKKQHNSSSMQLQEAHALWGDDQWGRLLDDAQANTAQRVKNIQCLFEYEFPVHSAFSIFCSQEPCEEEEEKEIRPFEQLFMLLLFRTESQDVVTQAAIKVAKRSYREKGLRLIGLQVVPRLFTNDVRTHKVHLAFCCVCSCN
jgi:hypothetical protein